MNFLSVTETTLAFCGRQYVHLYSTKVDRSRGSLRLEYDVSEALVSLDLHKHLPPGTTNLERVSAICCNLTDTGDHLCAADSEKNVFVFRKIQESWEHFSSFTLEKRVLRVQFDMEANHLIIVDKCGDVLVSSMSSPHTVSSPFHLQGISALTLDTILSLNNNQMLTCDGQIKMFVSRFPDGHEIKAYSFGRAETVANISLFNYDQILLSVCGGGTIKMWNMADHRCLKTFNLFHVMHGVKYKKDPDTEIKRLRLTEAYGHTYFAVKICGYKEIPVFELMTRDSIIRQLGQVKMDSEFCDFGWFENTLFTYNPEIPIVLKRFTVSSSGVLCDPNFQIPRLSELRIDFRAFVSFMKCTLTLRKHFSSDIIRLSQGQKLMDDFITAAERKIPRLVRGSRSKAQSMIETDTDSKPGLQLPIPVSLKYFRDRNSSVQGGAVNNEHGKNTPALVPDPVPDPDSDPDLTPEPSHPGHVSRIQSRMSLENQYMRALSQSTRLQPVPPLLDTDEPRPLTRGTSRILQNYLKKSQEAGTPKTEKTKKKKSTTKTLKDPDRDLDPKKTAEEETMRPNTQGRTRSRGSFFKSVVYDPTVPIEIKKDEPDDEVTKISKETAQPFLETLRIANPSSTTRRPHWPTELTHIISSRPDDSDFDADDEVEAEETTEETEVNEAESELEEQEHELTELELAEMFDKMLAQEMKVPF